MSAEIIPDKDRLFRRVLREHIEGTGRPAPAAFSPQGKDARFSVDWDRYTSAAGTRCRCPKSKSPSMYGVIAVTAKVPRSLSLDVVHCPEVGNKAHSEIRGSVDARLRIELLRECNWVIGIDDPVEGE